MMLEVIDTLLLSRIQFAFTLSFHILFPTFTIGLSVFLVIWEALWLKTQSPHYLALCQFWSKLFALAFGMGVVSGIVLSYEFGTNFAAFSERTGNVIGPLIGYEVMTAFFLEAGFLGIMLFGWKRVPKAIHFASTCIVSIGTLLSAFWILSANSWMQTPVAYDILPTGEFVAEDFWRVIFNPSFPFRYAHKVLASLLTATFVIAGVSAWYLRHQQHVELARSGLSLALWCALFLAPLQLLVGDQHGLNTLAHQPIKIAAMEGLWETTQGAPLLLFAIPDKEAETNHAEIKIPHLASLILTHDPNGEVVGLKSVPKEDRPPVGIVFYAFRIMVGIGFLFIGMALWGLWLRVQGKLYNPSLFHRVCQWVGPLGFVATVAGWFVTEVGRQPWVVQGLMRTSESASHVPVSSVWMSFIAFVLVYSILMVSFLFYFARSVKQGPVVLTGPIVSLSQRIGETE